MNPDPQIVPGAFRLATGLVGFGLHTELRVKVTRICTGGQYANVITADLADAGTKLVLGIEQLKSIDDPI